MNEVTNTTSALTTTIAADKLIQFIKEVSEKAGLSKEDAMIFAESLVEANLLGIDTHGVSRLAIYFKRISLGLIDAKAVPVFKQTATGVGMLDAKNGLGQVAGMKAMRHAVQMAKESGIAGVGVKNSQHFGVTGYYCVTATKDGCIGLAFTNAEPALPPWGSYESIFGTNPIAMAVPTGTDVPVLIDLSTSIVARGKIIAASKKGEQIPEGWALDSEGKSTTDAGKALEGAVLTMAGPKGYALALMVDIFSGVLTGGGFGKGVKSMYKDLTQPANVGHFLVALNIEAFMPKKMFYDRMRTLIDSIKSAKRRDGTIEIHVPGERKMQTKQERLAHGIRLDEPTLKELREIGLQYSVNMPN
jgi:LDH2 family malate/lactate/ureidoglycolate dehydrogenase